jgi:iron complex outermembrane receptor protein
MPNRPFHMFDYASALLSLAVAATPALAQGDGTPQNPATERITLPEVTVTAQKEPARAQDLPVALTAVTADMIARAGISIVSEAALTVPNTVFTEFTARKLSNARFRGLGASPANPAIATFIDGVPLLNANASSLELIDVGQIEFVRGPQSALFGRNSLGGLVNISSARPSLTRWTGRVSAPLGENGTREFRGVISGPLTDALAISLAGGHGARDGYTTNAMTGRRVDDRSGSFGKAQLLWTPSARWEARVIVGGERSRDGDYTLGDLGGLRQDPFTVMRDFEGYQHRDVRSGTLLTRYEGDRVSVSTTTGYVSWDTRDATDLDYSPLPMITRDNREEARQFSQEVRVASSAGAPVRLSDSTTLAWQAGGVVFTQAYSQDAINSFAPFLLSPFIGFPVSQHSPKGELDDLGFGGFAQATFTVNNRVDVAIGARADRETREAALDTFFSPVIAPPATVAEKVTYSNISPNGSVTWHVRPGTIAYATAGRGYKAGGFNPVAPPSAQAYGEEHTWTIEGGVKRTFGDGRVRLNTALFLIDWTDLQLNLPVPMGAGQFYIANVGGATSRGVEVELAARAGRGIDVFGAVGLTRARFDDGVSSGGVDVSDRTIPFTPEYTLSAGIQATRRLTAAATLIGRFEIARYGEFHYDEANTASQQAYSLANARVGVDMGRVSLEGWARNLFDTRYVPTAFAYPGFAPSGFVGEPGRPRTLGITLGIGF